MTCLTGTIVARTVGIGGAKGREVLSSETPTARSGRASKRIGTTVSPTLLERIAQGDESAVKESVETYSPLVWSLARRLCRERTDAEDAVQEIFIDVWKSAARFNPEVASESTFVAMIARRRLIDRLRRQGRRPDMSALSGFESEDAGVRGPAPAQGMSAPMELTEDAERALEAMQALTEDQQRVLRLSIMQGRSHSEIAEITGMPLGTVKTHARRGLMRIRAELEGAEAGRLDSGGAS